MEVKPAFPTAFLVHFISDFCLSAPILLLHDRQACSPKAIDFTIFRRAEYAGTDEVVLGCTATRKSEAYLFLYSFPTAWYGGGMVLV